MAEQPINPDPVDLDHLIRDLRFAQTDLDTDDLATTTFPVEALRDLLRESEIAARALSWILKQNAEDRIDWPALQEMLDREDAEEAEAQANREAEQDAYRG